MQGRRVWDEKQGVWLWCNFTEEDVKYDCTTGESVRRHLAQLKLRKAFGHPLVPPPTHA